MLRRRSCGLVQKKEDSDSEDDGSLEEPEPVNLSSFGVKKEALKVKK